MTTLLNQNSKVLNESTNPLYMQVQDSPFVSRKRSMNDSEQEAKKQKTEEYQEDNVCIYDPTDLRRSSCFSCSS